MKASADVIVPSAFVALIVPLLPGMTKMIALEVVFEIISTGTLPIVALASVEKLKLPEEVSVNNVPAGPEVEPELIFN